MTVVAPSDPVEARLATEAILSRPGPCYLRLGRDGEAPIYAETPDFSLGTAIRVREGTDLTLIVSTGLGAVALAAADRLQASGLRARVLSVHTIKPLDRDAVISTAAQTGAVFTVEEHSIIGGLGSAVAETLAEADVKATVFRRIGLPDRFSSQIGDQNYLRACYGLDPEGIAATVAQTLGVTQVNS
jgi:transketolase